MLENFPDCAVSGVHTGAEALMFCNRAEGLGEICALLRVQTGGDVLIVRTGHPPDVTHDRLTGFGEVKRVDTAIIGIATALQQATLLQLVDESHHPAGHEGQMLAERLLAAARCLRDGAQDARQRWSQVKFGHPLAETVGRMRPDLGEQERDTTTVRGS